ncbi:unnamed protein product, partial [Hapterophycus canaliculatus]
MSASVSNCGPPLVVSVLATLRSGDGRYLEEKAVLEILVSMPGFARWSSQPDGPAAAAAAAAAAADGIAAAPAAMATPSAPPASSSEGASLATSLYSSNSSHSASFSLGGEATAGVLGSGAA